VHLTLHLTNRCNLACRYCYAARGSDDMSFKTAIAAITRCAEGPNCGIIFFGGEPLLRKELIWDVIAWCEKTQPQRFHYKVTTNGTLLDEAFMGKAVENGLHVALSHDGVGEAHDACRVRDSGAGTFHDLEPVLELLLSRRPYSPVMMTVNPATVAFFARSVQWLQSKGVQYLIASLNYAGSWNDASLRQLQKEYLKLEAWHEENYRLERKFYFSPFDKRIASHVFPDRSNSCRLGKRQISVAPDGGLFPCVQFVGRNEYRLGTAADGIDAAKREAIFACNEAAKPTCAGCALDGRCHNKCGCLNIQVTGKLNEIPAILCEHERMVFPIADRLASRLFKTRDPMFLQRHYNPAFPILSFLEDLAV
jgi:uncharacterized protein